jgi:hypothetical protein
VLIYDVGNDELRVLLIFHGANDLHRLDPSKGE